MQENLNLGIAALDATHQESLTLLDDVKSASKEDFMVRFDALIAHTKAHFESEETIMREHAFYGYAEHRDEHANLLGEMIHFYEKGKKIPAFARSYIDEYAYEKFRRHIINIDSQLAMFLKEKGIGTL